jgi:GMP synthase-like glutamine amidotransferase
MGEPPTDIVKRYGRYADTLAEFYGADDFEFKALNIHAGEPLPTPSAFDGFMLSGSPNSANDNHAYIKHTQDFIRANHECARRPIVSTCFGHQNTAVALGGKVVKAKARGVGIHKYKLTKEGQAFFGLEEPLLIAASHEDQVIELPTGAILLAASSFCPIAAFQIGPNLCFQPHLEYSIPRSRDNTEIWHAMSPTPAEIHAEAMASYERGILNSHLLRPKLQAFLRGELNL